MMSSPSVVLDTNVGVVAAEASLPSMPDIPVGLKAWCVERVPEVARGHFSFQQLSKMEFRSSYGSESAEGIYLRRDAGDWLEKRSKLVRPTFRQSIETHWSRHGIRPNGIGRGK